MKSKKRIATIIRLIARIWSSLFLLFLLFMVGAHVIDALFGTEGTGDGGFRSTSEMLTFYLCFPVGTMVGLAIAWKWEGLGGLITAGGIICQFVMRPDLITSPYFVGMGVTGLLFVVYWLLTRRRQVETEEPRKEQHNIRRNNIVIALLVSFVPLLIFQLFMGLRGGNSIATEKDSSYNKKVEQVEVIITVEEPLIYVFAHSFEHSLTSAFESNGVDVIVSVNPSELTSLSDNSKEAGAFIPEAILHISIKPLYRMRDDGHEAIVGTDYKVSFNVTETESRVWHATGKVDYIRMFSSNYTASKDIRKEFAWSTTAAIVNAFITEVNNQKPKKIFTVTEGRQRNGQRID